MTASKAGWETTEKVVYEISLRGGVKKGIFYGQADCKLLSPTPPYGQLIVNLFWCSFDLTLWLYVFWNGFYTWKRQFSSSCWNPQFHSLDDHLQEACPSGWSFARVWPLKMIICKRPVPPDHDLQEAGPLRMIIYKSSAPPDDHLQEVGSSGWPFAKGLSLRMIICKSLAPPDDHLQESGSPWWSFARGRLLWMTICKRPVPPDDHLQESGPSIWSFARGQSLGWPFARGRSLILTTTKEKVQSTFVNTVEPLW